MEREPGRTAEDEEVAAAQLDIGPRTGTGLAVAETKDAAVGQADGDDRTPGADRARRLGYVLVQAEFGCGAVEIDDRRVETGPLRRETGGNGSGDAQPHHVRRQRLDRCAVVI